jgi:tRNA threonylcarbamoyl adenosine modification protein YeaZ
VTNRIVLGIESAIAGGSICITNNGREVDSWIGDQSISKAEELLPNIDRLLRVNSIKLKEIDRIIVSSGPGSFTGIKVGISTVLGLRAALGTTCVSISTLHALSSSILDDDLIAAVPVGRGTICFQSFAKGQPTSEPKLVDQAELIRISSDSRSKLILHGSLFDRERFPNAIDAGWNMALHLCSTVDSQFVSDDLSPLFVERKSSNI